MGIDWICILRELFVIYVGLISNEGSQLDTLKVG